MKLNSISLLPGLAAGLVSTASAHTDATLSAQAHFSGHLVEATLIGLVLLALIGSLRAAARKNR